MGVRSAEETTKQSFPRTEAVRSGKEHKSLYNYILPEEELPILIIIHAYNII